MWEAYGLENEDFLWTGIPFLGGIGGFQNAPCGVVSSTAVCLGLRHRAPLEDKERAKQARHAIRTFAAKIVSEFNQEFGDINCRGLIGMDFSKPGVYKTFLESLRAALQPRIETFLEKQHKKRRLQREASYRLLI